MPKKLTPKRERFCLEYVKDFNGARAARDAGYSERTARSIANELLTNPDVQARIAELQRGAVEKANITVERVLKEYERLAFSRIDEVFDLRPDQIVLRDDISESAVRAIASVEATTEIESADDEDALPVKVRRIKVRMHDKLKALDALKEYLGLGKPDQKAQRALEWLLEQMEGRVSPELYAQLLEAVADCQGAGIEGVAEGPIAGDMGATKH